MNEMFKKIVDQILKVWKEMDYSAKFISSLVVIGILVGTIVWANWIQKEEFGLLFSGKDTKEVAEVVSYLRDSEIPYKIKERGKSVYVPTERIYETRLSLSTEGLIQDKVGFEMFENVKFGITNFAQKINYRRALQGELARTISQLDPVEAANIQVVIPDESLFIEEEKHTTASIVLKLKSRRSLTQAQVQGIVQLVSSSVEGLDVNDVTITDNNGNLLSVKETSSMISKNNEQLDLKKNLENYYVEKATSLVSRVLGQGKVVVKVSAEMEFKNIDEKQIIYDPDRKVPKTQKIITRVSSSSSRGGGLPGTDSNIRQVGLVQESGPEEEEETIQTQYDTSRIERLVSEHAGVLQRLTVAILVDGQYETVEEEGETLRKYIPLPEITLNHIGTLVKNALGISVGRGDSLEIKNLQFSVEEEEFVAEEQSPMMRMVMDNISFIITFLAFTIFAVIIFKRMAKRKIIVDEDEKMMFGPDGQLLSKEAILKKKLEAAGISSDDVVVKEKEEAEKAVQEFELEHRYEGIKEGMLKSAAMKELLKKPGKDVNTDLEVFKDDLRKTVQKKGEVAVLVLKRWLSQ